MKAYDLVQAMNDIDEKYIDEAIHYKKPATNMKLWRAIAIAACVCLAGTLTFTIVNMGTKKASPAFRESASLYNTEYAGEDAASEVMMFDQYDAPMALAPTGGMEYAAEMENATASNTFQSAAMEKYVDDDMEEALEEDGGTVSKEAKIIYNVNMDMETTDFDQTNSQLIDLVTEYDGYCENQNISNNTGSYRYASYTIRIPAEHLEEFLYHLEAISTVTHISRSAEDVSESYYDISSRLDTAKAKLARLQDLLAEAEDMEDIITIESAISDTQWEIDSYSSSLNYYDSRITYSTVTLFVNEVYEVIVDEVPQSFGDKISAAFSQGIRSVGNFLKDAVIWLAASWMWLIIIVVIIVIIILIVQKYRRTHRSKKDSDSSDTLN